MYSTSHDLDHSLSQELSLSEEVSEVDVEYPAGLGDEKVVEVSIADAEDVGHDTIGRCSRERGRTMKVRYELLSRFVSPALVPSDSNIKPAWPEGPA